MLPPTSFSVTWLSSEIDDVKGMAVDDQAVCGNERSCLCRVVHGAVQAAEEKTLQINQVLKTELYHD